MVKNEAGDPIQDAEVWINFCKTGSIRTRLLALYKVSELLANLHARGLYTVIFPAVILCIKN